MASLRELVIEVRSNTVKFEQGLSHVNKRLDNTAKIAKRAGGVLTAALAGAGMSVAIKSAIDYGDKLQKLSTRLGATTESLSQLAFVGEQSGVSFGTMSQALQRSTRRIAEAAQGTGEAKDALKELGLSAQELNQLSPDQQFLAIAQQMSEVANQGDRVRLAMKLFDSEGVALIQTMEGGAAGVQALIDQADSLGRTLSGVDADNMAAANDAINRMRSSVTGFAQALAARLAPHLTDLADFLTSALPAAAKGFSVAILGAKNVLVGSMAFMTRGVAFFLETLSKIPGAGKLFEGVAEKVRASAKVLTEMNQDYRKEISSIINEQDKAKKSSESFWKTATQEAEKSAAAVKKVEGAHKSLKGFLDGLKESLKVGESPVSEEEKASKNESKAFEADRLAGRANVALFQGRMDKAVEKARQAAKLIRELQGDGVAISQNTLDIINQVAEKSAKSFQTQAESATKISFNFDEESIREKFNKVIDSITDKGQKAINVPVNFVGQNTLGQQSNPSYYQQGNSFSDQPFDLMNDALKAGAA